MLIHEYGKQNEKTILLFHPSCVRWDIFAYTLVPLLKERYHVLIPAIYGYDEEHPEKDFTSVEAMCQELGQILEERGLSHIDLLYGQSMGGSFVMRMIGDQRIRSDYAVMDGGIMPYELPEWICRLIWLRDISMVSLGKKGGVKLLENLFDPKKYGQEELAYVADVLEHMSQRTIRNTFWSCDNFSMPDPAPHYPGKMFYWYGAEEKKERKLDMRWIKRRYPECTFEEFAGLGHAEALVTKPQMIVERFERLLG